jgi:hypothetical protein
LKKGLAHQRDANIGKKVFEVMGVGKKLKRAMNIEGAVSYLFYL